MELIYVIPADAAQASSDGKFSVLGGGIENILDDIAKLGSDWDSYGADPPSPLAIDMASKFLRIVDEKLGRLALEQSRPQIVAPRPDGGIQIEWGTRPVKIAIHTDPSGGLGYLYVDRQKDIPEYKEVASASWDEVLQLIAKVVFTVPR